MIDSDRKLIGFRKQLHEQQIKRIAMDFECEYNLHAYGARLCLIQIFDGDRFYLIDPFRIRTEELAKTLESKTIVKLFYAATSDRLLVFRQYGIRMKSVYDLALLVDALGFTEQGLDSILEAVLGVEVRQKKKFQRYNWTLRPIREDALQYALNDVCHLFELHEKLIGMMKARDKLDECLVRFVKNDLDFEKTPLPPVLRSREFKNLSRSQKERCTRIVAVQHEVAQRLDCPPHNVLPQDKCIELARNPRFLDSPRFDKGLNGRIVRRFKKAIRDAGL